MIQLRDFLVAQYKHLENEGFNKGFIRIKNQLFLLQADRPNKFISIFNPMTGFYMRTGVLELGEDGNYIDTNVDPFMAEFPSLIDVGIMGHCIHGASGLCIKSGVQCYQNGLHTQKPNMTLEQFKTIVEECQGRTNQFALGGRGDVNKHEQFEELVKYCREHLIVPNYTTSGLDLTEEEVAITKKYCGAVAVSWYRQDHTINAINKFLEAGIKTNIHFVLGKNSIAEAINRVRNNDFPKGVNAVIFLLHKPIGLGTKANMLDVHDPQVRVFFDLINTKANECDFKIGFDSCTIPALVNFTDRLRTESFDTCEGARYSMYITSDMIALPCSFDNQDLRWGVDLNTHTIEEAWNSNTFESFRKPLKFSCMKCSDRENCKGGCPIVRSMVLCDREEINLYEVQE